MSVLEGLKELASTATLYHSTDPRLAMDILKAGYFRLALAETNKSESAIRVVGKPDIKRKIPATFYLSTARTLSSGYIADRAETLGKVNMPVTLVLDTAKMSGKNRGMKIRSFDYWGLDNTGRSLKSAREAEERIYLDKPKLNVKGCVKSVLIFIRKSDPANSTGYILRQLYSFCLKHRIPCKLFTWKNFQGFLRQKETQKDHDEALQILMASKRTFGYQTSHKGITPFSSKTATKFWNRSSPGTASLSDHDALKEMVEKNDYGKLSDKVKGRYFRWGMESLREGFTNYLQNLRGEIKNGKESTEKLYDLMQKTKSKNLDEFFGKLDAKWAKLRKEYNDAEDAKWQKEHDKGN